MVKSTAFQTPLARLAFSGLCQWAPTAQVCQCGYRQDAKGRAAHSVRDRLTALLAKRVRTANIQLGTARERSDRTRNGQLRLCRSTSRRNFARCSKWAHLHFSSASAALKPCKCALARSTAKPLSHTWKVASRNGVVRDRMALFYNDFEEFVFPNGLFDCKGCLRGTDACENKIGWAWCYLCPSSIQGLTCHQFCGATKAKRGG